DLAWEMQGELGTSHAYEMGGDYRLKPQYNQGYLGADFSYDPESGAWRIERIVPGDTWDPKNAPPLLRPGVNVSEGMLLLAVGGEKLDRETLPQKPLVNLAGEEIALTVAQNDKSGPRQVRVKTLESETGLRYRAWVEKNRGAVHEKSGGAAGYIHIPDMAPPGYAEFHRGFLAELDYDGLVVDVRFNGGGHFSQLLLEKLARRRVGYEISRWMSERPYPTEAPKGPMVCLTNEFAGSDGDIVCQAFKLMKLGLVIGRRTWGGVIGIWPRNALVDGTLTTQPEFSHWFQTVGWGVENYGVEPDIEVDIRPQDWAAERDPQLDRAIAEVLEAIKANPPHTPDFSQRPDLGLRL
ncbi:MAG: PDZ domain-containing protein, partial [Candidatus Sumerlaeota bacterium]|nr:PDZ domain-containing protein [Candidatus Sumerlaeota bacterium]